MLSPVPSIAGLTAAHLGLISPTFSSPVFAPATTTLSGLSPFVSLPQLNAFEGVPIFLVPQGSTASLPLALQRAAVRETSFIHLYSFLGRFSLCDCCVLKGRRWGDDCSRPTVLYAFLTDGLYTTTDRRIDPGGYSCCVLFRQRYQSSDRAWSIALSTAAAVCGGGVVC